MHKDFENAANNLYYGLAEKVTGRLKGIRDNGFPEIAGFNLANPAVFAKGEHKLTQSGLVASSDSALIAGPRITVASQPFAILFGSTVFSPQELSSFLQGLREGRSNVFDDLSKQPRIDQADPTKSPIALVGVTFSRAENDTYGQVGDESHLPAVPDTNLAENFGAYGFVGLVIKLGSRKGEFTRSIRFFGSRQDLVLPDGEPIDVNLEERDSDPSPQDMNEFRLTKYDASDDNVIFGQSSPKQFTGSLQVINEIQNVLDVRTYMPDTLMSAVGVTLH
jgi:hypothetical protein